MAYSNSTDQSAEELLTGDERILVEAKRRFQMCERFEADTRKLWLDDVKFVNADSDNGYQWPNAIRRNRDVDERPCLTINKTRQHCLQIINDAKQNKPSVKVRPTGGQATYKAAQAFEGIFRHIEYISNAQQAYDTATTFQVQGGVGYFRVITDYLHDDTFDQEIFIRRVRDPMTVYMDPDSQELDRSDARFCFIFDDMSRDEFNETYPEYKNTVGQSIMGNADGWVDKDHVRIAEYYRVVAEPDQLLSFKNPQSDEPVIMRRSQLVKMMPDQAHVILEDPATMKRELRAKKVEWILLIGDKVARQQVWAGETIPVVPVIGEETLIEGRLDRKGHVRNLKDPQRIYNYWSSSGVENVALQSKTPYIGPMAAFEGYETYWNTANRVNHAWLPTNHIDDEGKEIPQPIRQEPPHMAPAYVQGMQISQQDMMMASGQYQSQFGEKENATSGKAINERQRQGDNATYHYIDNLAVAIRRLGKILIDLVPKIYDTRRVVRILAQDGTQTHVQIDPQQRHAYQEQKNSDQEGVAAIFNPSVGDYEVEADVGPAYATRRQEAFNALSNILQQAPQMVSLVGDLLFRAADFPMADKVAERLEHMVPPQAKGEGPTPELQAAQQQIKQLTGTLEETIRHLADERLQSKQKKDLRLVEGYDAETKRLAVLLKETISPKDVAKMVHDLTMQAQQHTLDSVMQQGQAE